MTKIALAKSNFEASGKFGGVYFKKDSAGQHIQAMPRRVTLQQAGNQLKAKKWYGGKKHDEIVDPGPPVPDEPPTHQGVVKVYSLRYIHTYRDPSATKPPGAPEPEDEDLRVYCASLATQIWNPEWAKYGITLPLVAELLYHYWHIAMFTWGLVYTEAKAAAVEQTFVFVSRVMFVKKAFIAAPYIGWCLAAIIYSIGEFFAGHWGKLVFNKWDLMIRTQDDLFWGAISGRPTEQMYDTIIGPRVGFPGFLSWYEPDRDYGTAVYFNPCEIWQWLTEAPLLWYVWTVDRIHLINLGKAYVVEASDYWCQLKPFHHWYLNMPVGTKREPTELFNYLYNIHNLFIPEY